MEKWTVSIEIPLDEGGFLDRQCHFDDCGQYFKVLNKDWDASDATSVRCPFCGNVEEPHAFTTDEQQRYLEETAMAMAQEKMQELLGGLAKSINRRQSRNSLISMKMTTKFNQISVPVSPEAMESMRLQITCDNCQCTYAVVGAGFFCPLCGKNSARYSLQQSLAKTRNAVEVSRNLSSTTDSPDQIARVKRDSRENQIINLVTTFQRYGKASYDRLPSYSAPPARNLFQRLFDASTKWEAAGGRKFADILDARELNELLVYFQRRHVLT